MPINWQLQDRSRVLVVVTDPYSSGEWAGCMRAVMADPAFSPGMSILIDRRQATAPTTSFTQAQADSLIHFARRFGSACIAVLVREDDQASYGMCRMLELITEGRIESIMLQTFTSYEEAHAWLVRRECQP